MAKPSSISNSDILKVLARLGLFLVLFVLFNIGLSMALGKIYYSLRGGNSGAHINYFLEQRAPVLIFGASRANHHYSPQIISEDIGYDTYNAADDGKNASYQLGLLHMILTKYKPKVIVYDVGDFIATLDGGTVDLYPYYYDYPQVKAILDQRDKYAYVKFKFPLYAFNQKAFTVLRGYFSKPKLNRFGYRPVAGTIMQEEIDRYYENLSTFVEPAIDETVYENFIKVIETCKANNITLILCYSPRMFGGHFKYMTRVDSLANKYQIPYWNYANDPQFVGHNDLFKDSDHMNNKGAELFSIQLGKDLKNYLLDKNIKD